MAQTVILAGPRQRHLAHLIIDAAPRLSVVRVDAERRSLPQNARMWAMITDIARCAPEGRLHSPEVWKVLFMHAFGHEMRLAEGLNGEPVPVGFRSSRMSKAQMAEFITFIQAYGDQHGVVWSLPEGE